MIKHYMNKTQKWSNRSHAQEEAVFLLHSRTDTEAYSRCM